MRRILPLFLLVLAGLLPACTLVFSANTEEQARAAETLAAQIVQATLAANAAAQTAIIPTQTLTPTATPTATPVPPTLTPTLTPTATQDPADPRLALTEDPDWWDTFADDSYWYTYETDTSSAVVRDGQFVMTMYKPLGYATWTTAGLNIYDFYLEVTARPGPTCSGQDQYGVMFRAPDPNRGYQFLLACDGKYRLQIWEDGSATYIINWAPHSAIGIGPGAVNRIGVKAVGSTLSIYVNGVLIGTFEDTTFPDGGRFGLMVGAVSSSEFSVSYDDMAYWALP
ncbi:MAG: DUF1080 domain-containing protein [Anaerolineae bacterium]|nr:MAG: DUF1080 domain-containing protein [Anaerolineae bacterium]